MKKIKIKAMPENSARFNIEKWRLNSRERNLSEPRFTLKNRVDDLWMSNRSFDPKRLIVLLESIVDEEDFNDE
jgi:hypothetical protein